MKGGGGQEVKTTHIVSNPPNLVPFRAKTTMNYTDYGGSGPHPQAVTRGGWSAPHPQAVTS